MDPNQGELDASRGADEGHARSGAFGRLIGRGRRSTFWTMVQKLITPGLTLAVTILLPRMLSQDDYGAYGFLQSSIKYVALASSLGVLYVVQRYVPELREAGREGAVRRVVRVSLLLRSFAAIVVVAITVAAYGPLIGAFKVDISLAQWAIFGVATVCFLASGIMAAALNALFMHFWVVVGQVTFVVTKVALILLASRSGLTLTEVVEIEAVSMAVMLACYAAGYFLGFARHVSDTDTSVDGPRMRRYAAFSALNELGTTVFDEATDVLVIGYFLGSAQVALYYLATQVSRYIAKLNLANQFQSVLQPAFFTVHTESPGEANRMFGFLCKMSLFLTLPAVAVVLVAGGPLLGMVFGADYQDSMLALLVFAVFMPFNALAFPVGVVLQATERVEYLAYSKILSVYNLALSIILVKVWGIPGVALSTASATLFKTAYLYYHARRVSGVRLPGSALARLALNSALAGLLLLVARPLMTTTLAAVIGFALAGVLYLVAARLNRVFDDTERALINRVIGRRLWVF